MELKLPSIKKAAAKSGGQSSGEAQAPGGAWAGPGCAVSSDGRPLLGVVLPTASLVCLLSASGEKTPGSGEAAAGAESSRDRDTWDKEHGPGHPESRISWTVLCWEGLVGKGVAGSQGSSGERGYQPRREFWAEEAMRAYGKPRVIPDEARRRGSRV